MTRPRYTRRQAENCITTMLYDLNRIRHSAVELKGAPAEALQICLDSAIRAIESAKPNLSCLPE